MRLFQSLPPVCVFGVFSEDKCYIGYTENVWNSVARLYAELSRSPGLSALEVRVLAEFEDTRHLKLYCQYYRDHYRNMGYGELVGTGRKPLQYRVRSIIVGTFKYVDVELVTARGESDLAVGRFKTLAEAQDFMTTYYDSDNSYCFPVYAVNSLTKELLDKKKQVDIEVDIKMY